MSRSRIKELRENLFKDPLYVYKKAPPYINAQAEHLSHLKPGTIVAKRVTRATLEATSLYMESTRLLRISVR